MLFTNKSATIKVNNMHDSQKFEKGEAVSMLDVKKSTSKVEVCNKCGEINYDNVNFCQHCGSMLKNFTYVFCEVCGCKNSVENKICNECKNIL